MKKTIFIIAVILFLLGVVGFLIYEFLPESKSNEEATEIEYVVAEEYSQELNVERIVALDKEFMALLVADLNSKLPVTDTLPYEGYKWFETCILMDNWLDSSEWPEVQGVANIFQTQKKHRSGGTSCKVYLRSHTISRDAMDIRNGFWVEDFDLTEITTPMISFEEAYSILKSQTCEMPHSKHVVLRKAIGPNPEDTYNPQYIFGNADCHYYIDAITGEFSTIDPSGIPEESDDEPYFSIFRNNL